MSKARLLADFISTGAGTGILADGAIDPSEITGVTATASELNVLSGITASTSDLNNVAGINSSVQTQLDGKQAVVAGVSSTEIGYLDGVTSSLQTQLDNISVTSGSLTKSFTSGETASITLAQAISPAPVVSVTKEVPQVGISSKGTWDVNASASNYDLHNTAYATTLTPSTVLDLTSSTYDNNSRSTGGSYGPRFSSDGLKLFVNDQGANNIRQYNLSTAWLLPSSATHTTFSTASQVIDESGFCFSDNGLHFYLCDQNGSGSNTLHQYSITSGYPYDLVGYGSFTRTANMTSLGEAAPATRQISSVLVEDSGTKMYIFSGSGSSALIRQYTLSTAYDISSATYANKSFDIYADYGSGGYLGNSSLSSDGKQLLVANGADDIVMHYTLGTAWDISTASRIGTYNPAEDANVSGVHLKPDNSKFFMLGGSNQTFYRYTLGSSNALALGTGSFAATDVGKRIVGNGGDVTLTSTAGAYDTTGGSAFTDSSTIASGSWTMHGLKSAGDADGIGLAGYINQVATATGDTINTRPDGVGSTQGIFFKPDGTRFFIVDGDDDIHEFRLSTAWDLSTAGHQAVIASGDLAPRAITFSSDGTYMYVVGLIQAGVGTFNYKIYQFNLSTPWTIQTANAQNNWQYSNTYDAVGMQMGHDGTYFFLLFPALNTIGKYNLSSAYQIGTASYAGSSYEFTGINNADVSSGSSTDMNFNTSGTKVWVSHNDGTVCSYTLSTAWDVSTATYDGVAYDTGQSSVASIFVDSDTTLYVTNNSTDVVHEYSLGSTVVPTSQYHIAVTNSSGQINTAFWTDLNTMVADQAAGDGTVHYAVSTDDRTTWSVIKEGSGVRPIVRDNSGTWQYNSDLGSFDNNNLSLANYANDSFTFSNVGGNYTVDSFWSTDGTRLYIVKGQYVAEIRLSTAYDVSTGTYYDIHDVGSEDTVPFSVWANSNGSRMYVSGGVSDTIYQYNNPSYFSVSGVNYTGNSINVQAQDTENRGIWFGPENASLLPTKMFMIGGATNSVYEYSMSTAGNLSTASYSNKSFSVSTQQGDCSGLAFSADGTVMFVSGRSPEGVHQYSLSTAWDISTASYSNVFYDTTSFVTTPYGVSVSSNGEHLLIADETSGYVYNVSIGGYAYGTSTTWANSTTNDEFYALQQALGATAVNRMDKTQLDAVTDPNHFTLGNTLDLAIALRMDTASASTPTADGVTINYDAASLNQGAVLGTDYDYDFPDSTTVRVTSNAAQNLKVRVV